METFKNAQQAAEFRQLCTSMLTGCCGKCNLAAGGGSAQQLLARCVAVVFSSHQSRRVSVFKEWPWSLS